MNQSNIINVNIWKQFKLLISFNQPVILLDLVNKETLLNFINFSTKKKPCLNYCFSVSASQVAPLSSDAVVLLHWFAPLTLGGSSLHNNNKHDDWICSRRSSNYTADVG